jgi:hypothetical protein
MSHIKRRTERARQLLKRRAVHLIIQSPPIETTCPRCLQPDPLIQIPRGYSGGGSDPSRPAHLRHFESSWREKGCAAAPILKKEL